MVITKSSQQRIHQQLLAFQNHWGPVMVHDGPISMLTIGFTIGFTKIWGVTSNQAQLRLPPQQRTSYLAKQRREGWKNQPRHNNHANSTPQKRDCLQKRMLSWRKQALHLIICGCCASMLFPTLTCGVFVFSSKSASSSPVLLLTQPHPSQSHSLTH